MLLEAIWRACFTPLRPCKAGKALLLPDTCSFCRAFFENFGTVHEAFVSYDRHTGRPRGFGFVVFEDPAVADKVVSLQHTIDRREVGKPYHNTAGRCLGALARGGPPGAPQGLVWADEFA